MLPWDAPRGRLQKRPLDDLGAGAGRLAYENQEPASKRGSLFVPRDGCTSHCSAEQASPEVRA